MRHTFRPHRPIVNQQQTALSEGNPRKNSVIFWRITMVESSHNADVAELVYAHV
ncbi:MAG: hypothetical protein RLZZ490_2432 [Cyanobacteriota bacterium]